MTKEIVKHEPKLRVQFFDGSPSVTIPASKREAFLKAINEKRFVEIDGMIWNTSQIKSVYDKKPSKKPPVWTEPA